MTVRKTAGNMRLARFTIFGEYFANFKTCKIWDFPPFEVNDV